MSSFAIETARHEWEDGARRLAAEVGEARVREQLRAVTEELRRRVGQVFTIEELVDEYADAERWVREVVEERAWAPGWERTLVLVEQAAFHRYARGAIDYRP